MGLANATPESLAEKAARKVAARNFRAAQRAKGLRLLKIWVPDTRIPEVAAMIRQQSLSKGTPQEQETLDWIERTMDYRGWS